MASFTSALKAPQGKKTRILIADDQPMIRRMVRSTLAGHPSFEVCGDVEEGGKSVAAAAKLLPDVVVLNISLPRLDGFQAAREIKAASPGIVIVILSSHTDDLFVEEAKKPVHW